LHLCEVLHRLANPFAAEKFSQSHDYDHNLRAACTKSTLRHGARRDLLGWVASIDSALGVSTKRNTAAIDHDS
jgi:hypothetical protein